MCLSPRLIYLDITIPVSSLSSLQPYVMSSNCRICLVNIIGQNQYVSETQNNTYTRTQQHIETALLVPNKTFDILHMSKMNLNGIFSSVFNDSVSDNSKFIGCIKLQARRGWPLIRIIRMRLSFPLGQNIFISQT